MSLRKMLGADAARVHEQVDAFLDSEDGMILLVDGSRAISYTRGFGISPCQMELLTLEIERAIRHVGGTPINTNRRNRRHYGEQRVSHNRACHRTQHSTEATVPVRPDDTQAPLWRGAVVRNLVRPPCRPSRVSFHNEVCASIRNHVRGRNGAADTPARCFGGPSLADSRGATEFTEAKNVLEDSDVSEIRTLSTQELQQLLDRDNGLHVLNVQTNPYFAGELIPGSRRAPLDTIEHDTRTISKDADIVTYCGGATCSQSTEAARKLIDLGYTKVRVLTGGLDGWKAAGHEIVKPEPAPAA
jgi:rhodanese-related sulfurtransferase